MLSILVVGATGKQGSAVVHSFLSSSTEPVSIHALTRSATSPGALALAKQGVTLHAGSLEDSASLVAALQGREAAFLFTTQEPGEVERGRRFIEAAKEAGVKRIVFSSVQGAQARTGVPHWETKAEIEELVKTSGLRWTILRPAMFYESKLVVK